MNNEQTVLIVIPTFNEETRLPSYLEALFCEALRRPDTHFTFLLSDDDSSDRTVEMCESIYQELVNKKNLSFVALNHGARLGKGNAVVKGFQEGVFDYKGFIDADGAISAPEVFAAIDNLMSNENVDAIFGMRIFNQNSSLKRKILSLMCLVVAHIVVFKKPVNDAQCPLKFFRSKFLDRFLNKLKSKSGLLDIELIHLCHKTNGTIVDFPVLWQNDENSRIKIKNEVFLSIFRIIAIKVWHRGSQG